MQGRSMLTGPQETQKLHSGDTRACASALLFSCFMLCYPSAISSLHSTPYVLLLCSNAIVLNGLLACTSTMVTGSSSTQAPCGQLSVPSSNGQHRSVSDEHRAPTTRRRGARRRRGAGRRIGCSPACCRTARARAAPRGWAPGRQTGTAAPRAGTC